MKKPLILSMSAVFLLLATGVAAQQADFKGCKDHPLFPTRMPEYRIADCKIEAYGVYEFFTTKGPKTRVEGKFTFITFAFTGERASEPSGLAVVRNYESAIQTAGGTIRQSAPERWVNGKIVKGGEEAWVQAEKGKVVARAFEDERGQTCVLVVGVGPGPAAATLRVNTPRALTSRRENTQRLRYGIGSVIEYMWNSVGSSTRTTNVPTTCSSLTSALCTA